MRPTYVMAAISLAVGILVASVATYFHARMKPAPVDANAPARIQFFHARGQF